MMPGSTWSRGGLAGIIACISAIIVAVILHFGPSHGLDTRLKQVLAFAAVWIVLLIVFYTPFMFRFTKEKYYRWQEQKKNALPSDESRVARTPPRNVTVDSIRDAMRNLYGRRWGSKTRILLVTGTTAEVEQLTPGLTTQLWQEDRGTLLLWGGDLNTPADSAWLAVSTPSDEEPASRHPAGYPGPGCAGAYTHRATKGGSARVTQTPLPAAELG